MHFKIQKTKDKLNDFKAIIVVHRVYTGSQKDVL